MWKIRATSNMYKDLSVRSFVINEKPVFDKQVFDFYIKLYKLNSKIDYNNNDPLLKKFVYFFFKIRRKLISTPCPLEINENDMEDFESKLHLIEIRYQLKKEFQELLNLVKNIKTNELILNCEKYFSSEKDYKSCFVAAPKLSPETISILKTYISDRWYISFKSIDQFKNTLGTNYKSIYLIGPPSWYNEFSFLKDGICSEEVYFIYYDWLNREKLEFTNLKGRNEQISSPLNKNHTIESNSKDYYFNGENFNSFANEEDLFFPSVLAPVFYQDNEKDFIKVNALRFILGEGYHVYLESKSGIDILDDSDINLKPRRNFPVKDLHSGMYIILKTGSGGSDYIKEYAQKEYPDYNKYNDILLDWKTALLHEIDLNGIDTIIQKLKNNGALKANRVNVENWSSWSTIKPGSLEDFAAIIKLLKKDEKIDMYWDSACKINNMHVQTGRKIFKELREKLSKLDNKSLENLRLKGRLKLSINIYQGTSSTTKLSVFKILNCSNKIVQLPVSKTRKPINMDIL